MTESKPVAWKVEVDYKGARINPGSATKKKGMYADRKGVIALVNSALRSGVHPRFIKIQKVYGTWEDEFLTHCPDCNVAFDEPSDDCPNQRNAQRINERRESMASPARAIHRTILDPVDLPHSLYPLNITIQEQELVP